MTFTARPQLRVLILLFFLAIPLSFTIRDTGIVFYTSLIFLLFISISGFIRYEFTIKKLSIIYKITFFNRLIFTKTLQPEEIDQITLKRTGWATKAAMIRVKKGLNLRITLFIPDTIYQDIEEFANDHKISISKTKDYLIIEKG